MNLKSFIRRCLPSGLIEARHRRFKLSRLHLPITLQTESDVETCRYDLWPAFLRNDSNPWSLVDVGANVGDFVKAAANLRRFDSIYAFEPQPSCHDELVRSLKDLPRTTLIPAAVGRQEGSLDLHITANNRMASALPPDETVKAAYSSGDFDVSEKITVPMVTLDTTIPHDLEIGLLKLDVQGFEIEVLAGASSTLRRTRAILVELNYVRHYENGAGFDEVYSALQSLGFRVFGISAPFTSTDAEPLWADALFTNTKR